MNSKNNQVPRARLPFSDSDDSDEDGGVGLVAAAANRKPVKTATAPVAVTGKATKATIKPPQPKVVPKPVVAPKPAPKTVVAPKPAPAAPAVAAKPAPAVAAKRKRSSRSGSDNEDEDDEDEDEDDDETSSEEDEDEEDDDDDDESLIGRKKQRSKQNSTVAGVAIAPSDSTAALERLRNALGDLPLMRLDGRESIERAIVACSGSEGTSTDVALHLVQAVRSLAQAEPVEGSNPIEFGKLAQVVLANFDSTLPKLEQLKEETQAQAVAAQETATKASALFHTHCAMVDALACVVKMGGKSM